MEAVELRIATYAGNRQAAFSLTFDDGWRGEVEDAVAVLEPLGLKGTFFFMPLAMEKSPQSHASWERANELQAMGHEIGTHATVSPRLHECDAAGLDKIVNGGWQLINDKTGVAPVSFALPGKSHMTDAVKAVIYQKHYFVRRPNTFGKLARVMMWGDLSWRQWTVEREQKGIEKTIAAGGWRIATIHGIASGFARFKGGKQEFAQICSWIKDQEERLWIAPMGTVGRYIAARNTCSIDAVKHSAASCSFELSCPADKKELFTQALTVVIPVAADLVRADDANGKALPARVHKQQILVDVVPGSGPVNVAW